MTPILFPRKNSESAIFFLQKIHDFIATPTDDVNRCKLGQSNCSLVTLNRCKFEF